MLEQGAEILGEWRFDGMDRAVGVGESEELGVEGESGEDGAFGLFGFGEFEVAFYTG